MRTGVYIVLVVVVVVVFVVVVVVVAAAAAAAVVVVVAAVVPATFCLVWSSKYKGADFRMIVTIPVLFVLLAVLAALSDSFFKQHCMCDEFSIHLSSF